MKLNEDEHWLNVHNRDLGLTILFVYSLCCHLDCWVRFESRDKGSAGRLTDPVTDQMRDNVGRQLQRDKPVLHLFQRTGRRNGRCGPQSSC